MGAEIYEQIARAVTYGEEENARALVTHALSMGLPPVEIMMQGVVAGINKAGDLWHCNEFFLPDVILAAEAFKAAMEPLNPHLRQMEQMPARGKVVIGVVEGDVHDLGKNMVVMMLQSAGFEVIDLGINVPKAHFIEAVRERRPDILGLGAYMSTTMGEMREIIAELKAQGLRDGVKVMVGGVPTSQEFADQIGADAWGRDALDALDKALALVGRE